MKSLIIANATPSALSHPLRKQFIKDIDPDTRNLLAVPSSRKSVGSIIPSFLKTFLSTQRLYHLGHE